MILRGCARYVLRRQVTTFNQEKFATLSVLAPLSRQQRCAEMRAIIIVALISLTIPAPVLAGQVGIASRYCELQQTASGRKVTCQDLVAAHRTLPFGKRVKVRNLANGRAVTVTIVDRGPFVKGRIIDLSAGAANAIGSADLMRVEIIPQ